MPTLVPEVKRPVENCAHPMEAIVVWDAGVACWDCGRRVVLAVDGRRGGYVQGIGEPQELLLDQCFDPRQLRADVRSVFDDAQAKVVVPPQALLAEIAGLFESSICGDVGESSVLTEFPKLGDGFVDVVVGESRFRITAAPVK